MQNVSDAYKAAMAKPIRDQGHARFQLAVNDNTCYSNAYANGIWSSSFYRTGTLAGGISASGFSQYGEAPYSFAAMDMFKLDGSQILPNDDKDTAYPFTTRGSGVVSPYNGGLIAKTCSRSGSELDMNNYFRLTLYWSYTYPDIAGFALSFDTEYPRSVRVVITCRNEEITRDVTLNQPLLQIAESFSKVNYITVYFGDMSRDYTRVRVNGYFFGMYSIYENDRIETVTWKEFSRYIADEFPTQDVSIDLLDTDNLFNPDISQTLINMLDLSGYAQLYYGMTLEDETVEWVRMMSMGVVNAWQYTQGKLHLTVVDRFRNVTDSVNFSPNPNSPFYFDGNYLTDRSHEFVNDISVSDGVGWQWRLILPQIFAASDYVPNLFNESVYNGHMNYPMFMQNRRDMLKMWANWKCRELQITREGLLNLRSQGSYDSYSTLGRDVMLSKPAYSTPKRILTLADKRTQIVVNDSFDQSFCIEFFPQLRAGTFNDEYIYETTTPFYTVRLLLYRGNTYISEKPFEIGVVENLPNGAVSTSFDEMYDHYFKINVQLSLYRVRFTIEYGDINILLEEDWEPWFIRCEVKTISLETEDGISRAIDKAGDVMTWYNPLVVDSRDETQMANALYNYYKNTRETEIEYRGLPEIDSGDGIYYEPIYDSEGTEPKFGRVISNEVTFNGAFSGKLVIKES